MNRPHSRKFNSKRLPEYLPTHATSFIDNINCTIIRRIDVPALRPSFGPPRWLWACAHAARRILPFPRAECGRRYNAMDDAQHAARVGSDQLTIRQSCGKPPFEPKVSQYERTMFLYVVQWEVQPELACQHEAYNRDDLREASNLLFLESCLVTLSCVSVSSIVEAVRFHCVSSSHVQAPP
jgi:hypothetical protein